MHIHVLTHTHSTPRSVPTSTTTVLSMSTSSSSDDNAADDKAQLWKQAPKTPKGVIPYLTVNNGVKALDFYAEAFGAKETCAMKNDDGTKLMHASMDLNGGTFFLCDDMPECQVRVRRCGVCAEWRG